MQVDNLKKKTVLQFPIFVSIVSTQLLFSTPFDTLYSVSDTVTTGQSAVHIEYQINGSEIKVEEIFIPFLLLLTLTV
jgi:hypothetical protein